MASYLSCNTLPNKPITSLIPPPILPSSQIQPSLVKPTSFYPQRLPLQVVERRTPSVLPRFGSIRAQVVDTKQKPEVPTLLQEGVASKWKELHGSKDWNGLLDPIDPLLRTEILRYGGFTQANYDSFNADTYSRYCGSCRYDAASFFDQLNMSDCGYRVTRYLYAASNPNIAKFFRHSKNSKAWSTSANWMGYVAVSEDPETIKRLGRRDILISWRGTVTNMEWIEDLLISLKHPEFIKDSSIKVESGFLDLYITKDGSKCHYCKYSAREQVLAEVKRLVDLYQNEKEELSITITGHSLGGALAILSAFDIADKGLNVRSNGSKIPVAVFTFGGPRVGNIKFKEKCEELGVKVLRSVNIHDKVPTIPGVVMNDKSAVARVADAVMRGSLAYAHIGQLISLDHAWSPYLKKTNDAGNSHNLEMYLHLIDGYHGKNLKFESATGRDVALVNKSCDFLSEELELPPSWKQYENKGLVRTSDGKLGLPAEGPIEGHPPDVDVHLAKVLEAS